MRVVEYFGFKCFTFYYAKAIFPLLQCIWAMLRNRRGEKQQAKPLDTTASLSNPFRNTHLNARSLLIMSVNIFWWRVLNYREIYLIVANEHFVPRIWSFSFHNFCLAISLEVQLRDITSCSSCASDPACSALRRRIWVYAQPVAAAAPECMYTLALRRQLCVSGENWRNSFSLYRCRRRPGTSVASMYCLRFPNEKTCLCLRTLTVIQSDRINKLSKLFQHISLVLIVWIWTHSLLENILYCIISVHASPIGLFYTFKDWMKRDSGSGTLSLGFRLAPMDWQRQQRRLRQFGVAFYNMKYTLLGLTYLNMKVNLWRFLKIWE